MAQTACQEPGHLAESGAGIDEDPTRREVLTDPLQEHNEGMRCAIL